ncbi:MAG: 4Fe-4S binding protein [Oscillospiraceae bacterium]|nr:4Fe-4S binding protein [Oscillospiraceae bacterium]
MADMKVDRDRCKGCGLCVEACPKKIITIRRDIRNQKGYSPAECTDVSQCIGCAMCFLICPDCAIKVEK